MKYLVVMRWEPFVDQRVRTSHMRVLYWIGQHADMSGKAFPSLRRVATLARLSLGTVSKAVHDLHEWGYLRVETQRRDDGGDAVNIYWLNLEQSIPDVAPPVQSGKPPVQRPSRSKKTPPFSASERTTERPRSTAHSGDVNVILNKNAHKERSSIGADAPEVVQGLKSEPPANGNGKHRETWLTPYGERWSLLYGGEPAWGVLAKALAPLRAKHGDDVLIPAWERYLASTPAQYASPARFAQTLGTYLGGTPLAGTRDLKNRLAIEAWRNSVQPVLDN